MTHFVVVWVMGMGQISSIASHTHTHSSHFIIFMYVRNNKFVLFYCFVCSFVLQIRDGKYGYSKELGRFCGNEFPPIIYSSDRYLWLRFHSDENIEYSGFEAVFDYIQQPTTGACGDHNFCFCFLFLFCFSHINQIMCRSEIVFWQTNI